MLPQASGFHFLFSAIRSGVLLFNATARSQITVLLVSIFLIESFVQPLLHASDVFSAGANREQARRDFNALQNQVSVQMVEAMKTGFGGRDPMLPRFGPSSTSHVNRNDYPVPVR